MDSLSRDVQAQTTEHRSENQAEEIDGCEEHFPRGGRVPAPVEVEPEDTAEAVGEPGGEEGSLEVDALE
jgi:hypothetical protein